MDVGGLGTTAALASEAMKDVAGAQLVTKTLDKLNTTQSGMASQLNSGYEFQKSVLNAAGIGQKLDAIV